MPRFLSQIIVMLLLATLAACSAREPITMSAADQQKADQLYAEGLQLMSFRSATRDPQRAFQLLMQAAEMGHVEAMVDVANAYELGKGTAEDMQQALRWYEKAAQRGDKRAQVQAANIYYDGKAVEQDLEQAAYWYEKAAAQGDTFARHRLQSMNQ